MLIYSWDRVSGYPVGVLFYLHGIFKELELVAILIMGGFK